MPFLTSFEKVLIFFGLWFLILGTLLFLSTLKKVLNIEKHSSEWIDYKALIYQVDKNERYERDSDGNRVKRVYCTAYIEYQVDGETYRTQSPISDSRMREGDIVNIKYNRNEPNRIISKSGAEYKFAIGFSIIAMIIGNVCVTPCIIRYLKDVYLYKQGNYIESEVYEFRKTDTTVNGKRQYKLIVKYTNEDNKKFTFISKESSKSVLQKTVNGPIKVYVNSTYEPTMYYVQLQK